ncbi:MAG TPA: hypothetical protein VF262_07280 [Burkholderiales bacterium]
MPLEESLVPLLLVELSLGALGRVSLELPDDELPVVWSLADEPLVPLPVVLSLEVAGADELPVDASRSRSLL